MFTPNKIRLAIFSVMAAPSLALAADQETQLPTVEVSAPAAEEASQQKITLKEELEQNGNSETGVALRQIAGVEAGRIGGHGTDLSIRGQGQSQVNVLLDGAKIEGGCPNRMDPPTAYAEISSYDQVTVIKGVNSVQHGVGGSGGTVLFERSVPDLAQGNVQGEVNLGTASNGLNSDVNATVKAVNEKGFIVVQGSRKQAENYTDGNGDEVRTSYSSQQGHIDLGWTPSDDHLVKLSYEQSIIEDALFQGAKMDSPESDGRTARLQYKGKNLTSGISNLELDIYRSDVDHEMNNFEYRPAPANKQMETITDVVTEGAKIKLSSMLGHTQLDYGLQTEKLTKNATLTSVSAGKSAWHMWPDAVAQTDSIFAESTSFFKDNQKVILGLRYDLVDSEARDAEVASDMGKTAKGLYTNTYSDYSGDTDNTQGNLNALIRYERQYNNHGSMFAGISRTHRYADATEMFIAKGGMDMNSDGFADGGWIGNPDLDAEQHNQLDIGYAFNGKSVNWSANAFYDYVNDYILRDLSQNQANTTGTNNIVYVNKDARIFGAEAEFDWQVTAKTKIGANIAWTRGENTTDDRNLSNIAPISGAAFAEIKDSVLSYGARLSFADKQSYVNEELGELETAAWNQLDIYGGYQVNKNVQLMAGVDNLGDRAYQNYLNRVDSLSGNTYKLYEAGTNYWAKVKVVF